MDNFLTLGSSHWRMPVWFRCLLRRRLAVRVLRGQDVPLSRSITFKDLFAITAAVNTWTASLACRNILVHCDNLSVVHILSSGTRKGKHIITLLRFLFYICAYHDTLTIHIDGFDNHLPDALSRFQIDKFLAACPVASRSPTPARPLLLASFKWTRLTTS